MKIAIMQPYFFPYIGYFQLINAVDKFIIYENVNFRKKSWITRNRLLDKQKQSDYYFIVPVKDKSVSKKISQIEIIEDNQWKKKLIKSISVNYKKCSYYNETFSFVENLIFFDNKNLHDYNSSIIQNICNYLDIKTNIVKKNNHYIKLEQDLEDFYSTELQNRFSTPDKKTKRIIEICKNEGARNYLNPIGGEILYDKQILKEFGISVSFVKTNHINYKQFCNGFIPNLSIIDVLMHVGQDGTKKLLNEYSLV